MIFVTVGSQMAFDRLVSSVDDWAERQGRDDVVAQIGPSDYVPRRITILPFLDPENFRRQIEKADAIVAHAGMGTIISALECRKPLLVLPRLGDLGETRNDHQVATAKRFAESGRILAAYGEDELHEKLEQIERFQPAGEVGRDASPELLARLRAFVQQKSA